MRAIVQDRYGGPEQLRLADLPDPVPGRGEVLVQVLACGVNLSDWEALTGSPAYARIGGLFRPGRPILGSDIVGRVLALGPGVAGLVPGQRVMADVVMRRGGFAERALLPAALCAPVPEALSDAVAASLPQPGVIALQAMAGVRAGERVLINGAGGGTGTLALQLAQAAGAEVTVVDTAAKIAWLADPGAPEQGATDGIDYRQQDFTALGRTWDRILDLVATRPAARIARALAPGGRYQAVGGKVRIILPLAVQGLVRPGRGIGVLAVKTGAAQTAAVAALAAEGALRPRIQFVEPLDRVAQVMADLGAGRVTGKVVICP